MELQHVNVKLLVKESKEFNLENLIPVFHGWIQDQVFEERLLDVADYRHVHDGPGVILIGLEGDYSVDNADGRLGVRYNRKASVNGDSRHRLTQAVRAALGACQRLEAEPSLGGRLCFDGQQLEVFINDRLLAPNNETSRSAAEPELRSFFAELFDGNAYSLSFNSDPRRLFSVLVKTVRRFAVPELLNNLPK